MVYKLCYVDPNKSKAYFTSNWKEQWGDDWDDRPYETNDGEPYDTYANENDEWLPIKLKEIFFELPGQWKMPCDISAFSVEDINNHMIPWITCKGHYIFAGISYTNFVKQIEELGGKIYTPKRRSI